jgi:hypothetical protein
MRPHKILLVLAPIAGFLLAASLVFAEDAPPATPPPSGPGSGHMREFCKQNPGKCEEARAKHAAFCQENPEKCEQMKQRRAERQAYCEQNPEKCEQQRAQMKQHRAEMQAKCAADPAKCQEMKQQMRGHFQGKHGSGPSPAQ